MTQNLLYYIGANPTADLIVFNHKNEVLLIKRAEQSLACPGMWALPGGFVDSISKLNEIWIENLETPMQAAIRELKEETKLVLPNNAEVVFVNIYEGNKRDPRDSDLSWSKSHAYYYYIPEEVFEQQKNHIVGIADPNEVLDVKWISIEEALNMKLAFDHSIILNDAYMKFKNKSKLKIK